MADPIVPIEPPDDQLISDLVIEVGDVVFDDDVEYATDYDDGIFTDYLVRNRYEKDPQKYMIPVTSPTGFQGQSCAFVQLAAPVLLWVCDWTAQKVGSLPKIPNPTPADTNWVLLDEIIDPDSFTVQPDGQSPRYRISGTYVYGHKSPSESLIDHVVIPRPPWALFGSPNIDRVFTTEHLETGIIDLG